MIPKFVYNPGIYTNPNTTWLVLDFETSNLEFGTATNDRNYIVLSCWKIYKGGKLLKRAHKFGNEFEQTELLADLGRCDILVAQFAKFELQWLKRCGVDLRSILPCDPFLAEWVLQGNRKAPLNLNATAARYGVGAKEDLVSRLIKGGLCPSEIPKSWLLEYCEKDVDLAWEILQKQLKLLTEANQLHLLHTRNLTCACLADIEFNGVKLDEERVATEFDRLQRSAGGSLATLKAIAGEINFNSPKQVGELLYGKLGFKRPTDRYGRELQTDTGQPPTDAATIGGLRATNKTQRQFVAAYQEYSAANDALSKNIGFFKLICEERDGVFKAEFNQGQTANHRLSSSGRKQTFKGGKVAGAQLQNIARAFKRLFTTKRDGWLLVEADAAQLEFRAAAELARDSLAIEEISNWVDIHQNTADALIANGFDLGATPKEQRQNAKEYTFKPLYGGQGAKGSPARAYSEFFKHKYKGIAKEQRDWALVAAQDKKLTTKYGLTFYWPGAILSGSSGYVEYSTQIYNYPISGFATGEIIPIALIHYWYRIAGREIELVNTIHDSLISECHPDEIEYCHQANLESLTADVYDYLNRVYHYEFVTPLGMGFKAGTHWSEGAEVKYNVWPDGRVERRE